MGMSKNQPVCWEFKQSFVKAVINGTAHLQDCPLDGCNQLSGSLRELPHNWTTHAGLMVSALDSRLNSPALSFSWTHYIVFLSKKL